MYFCFSLSPYSSSFLVLQLYHGYLCAEDANSLLAKDVRAKEAEITIVRAEADQQLTELNAQIAELQSRLSERGRRLNYLEGRVEELVDEKADLEDQLLAADSDRDIAIAEVVAAVTEMNVVISARDEAVAAGKEQTRMISGLSQRVTAQDAELAEARTALSEFSQRAVAPKAELVDARTTLTNAVKDYLASADFTAAVDESCAKGSRWMRDALIAAFPEMSDRLRFEADAFMKRVFPNSEETVATPPANEGADV